MHGGILKLYVKLRNLASAEQGQDLVEYALLVSLIALGLIAAISALGAAINHAFGNISSSLV